MGNKAKQVKNKYIKTFMGRSLSCGKTSKDRWSRYKYYARDAMFFAIGFNLIKFAILGDHAFSIELDNRFLNVVFEVLFSFLVVFLMNFVWYELRIYREFKRI